MKYSLFEFIMGWVGVVFALGTLLYFFGRF